MSDQSSCPICHRGTLARTVHVLSLANILVQWEQHLRITFRDEVKDTYQGMETTLYRCNSCSFGMFRPVIPGSQAFYEDVSSGDRAYYIVNKWEFNRAIKQIEQLGLHRILDVGCGSGHFLDLLRQRLPSLDGYGYEFTEHVAEQARARGLRVFSSEFPGSVLNGAGMTDLDAVTAFQVLEHLTSPDEFFRSIQRLLPPGGYCFIAVPNMEGPYRHFAFSIHNTPPHHLSWWTEDTFKQGAGQFGFEVVETAWEPLADYHWWDYLPAILKHWIGSPILAAALIRLKFLGGFIRFMKLIGIKALPIPGHSLYVVLRRLPSTVHEEGRSV